EEDTARPLDQRCLHSAARAEERNPSEREGLAVPVRRLCQQDRGAGSVGEVLRVLGELREQEQRPALVVDGDRDQRAVGESGRIARQRRERGRARLEREGSAPFGVAWGAGRGGKIAVLSAVLAVVLGRRGLVFTGHGSDRTPSIPPEKRDEEGSRWGE